VTTSMSAATRCFEPRRLHPNEYGRRWITVEQACRLRLDLLPGRTTMHTDRAPIAYAIGQAARMAQHDNRTYYAGLGADQRLIFASEQAAVLRTNGACRIFRCAPGGVTPL
jgi:hypothetical protein